MNQVPTVRLTGRASRFLSMLVDFGHLDDARLDDLLVAVADTYGTAPTPTLVDLVHVRPLIAAYLLGGDPGAVENGPLAEDWAPLFH